MSEETKNVTLYQQTDQGDNPVAPLVPERGIYDGDGMRLDDKLKSVNLKKVSDAITAGVNTIQKEGDAQVAEIQNQLPTLKHQIGLDRYEEFNSSTTYNVGDVVLNEGHLYKYNVAHEPGAWNPQEVYEVSMEQDMDERKFNKIDITQESGDAEDKVMSQKAVSTKLSDLPSRPYTSNSTVNKGIKYLYIDKSKYNGNLDLSSINIRTITRNFNGEWVVVFEDSKTETSIGGVTFKNGTTQGSNIENDIYYYACVDWSFFKEGVVNLVHTKLNDNAYVENPKFLINDSIVQNTGESTDKVMSQKAVSDKLNQIKEYTKNTWLNRVIVSLYIDKSKYTGSLDLSSINIRTITRNMVGVWIVSFEDTSSQTAFCTIEFKDGVSQGFAEKDGVKAYACIDWSLVVEGVVNLVHAKLNDIAYVENPKFFLKDTIVQEINSVLYGKTLASIGDSITEGFMADNISLSDYYPISGSKKETFAYVIAKKYGMKWYNYGKSGSTMGDIFAIGADRNGFSKANGRYTQMAKDIDYLIIMFGTNDSDYGAWMKAEEYIQNKYGTYKMFPAKGHSVGEDGVMTQEEYQEVISYSGEINGTEYTGIDYWRHLYIGGINDNTNKTWCGAWNIVLEYLLINYKRSKIIIWLNPTNYNFDDSTIKLAEKWGIPYINMHDINTPTIWARKEQENTLIGDVKMNSFVKDRGITKLDIYTADGLHPNSNGYDRISDVIAGHLLNI